MAAERSPVPVATSRVIRNWRIALILLGLALLGTGGLVLLAEVSPRRYLGILAWFAGAIILHDGIIAPIVFGAGLIMRKAGRRMPAAHFAVILAVVQGAIVVAAIVSLIVFPEIVKKSIGTTNPTVLPLDYSANLLIFLVSLAVATVALVAGYATIAARRPARGRRRASLQKARESTIQH